MERYMYQGEMQTQINLCLCSKHFFPEHICHISWLLANIVCVLSAYSHHPINSTGTLNYFAKLANGLSILMTEGLFFKGILIFNSLGKLH